MRKYVSFYAEKSARELPEFAAIAQRFPEFEWIDDYQTFNKKSVIQEKQSLIFARKRGPWLKPFHCYDHAGYTFMSLDLAEGCLFDCVYCYLQSYLNHGGLVLFLDRESLLSELTGLQSGRCWISTGLLSDSLLSENQHSYLPEISCAIPDGCLLELRSKGADLTPLVNVEIRREPVVLSWSLNPPEIIRNYEYGTVSLEHRLQAARDAIELGYRVAFHLDPVFHFDGWQKAYRLLFDQLEQFPKEKCAFLSVGLFRYMPDLGSIMRQRFPYHPVLSDEFFRDEDGKYHYFRAIRNEMFRTFEDWLKRWEETPVFWSQRLYG